MGVTKTVISPGNGQQFPQKGDQISMHYTGCLYDENAPNKMGKQYGFPPLLPSFQISVLPIRCSKVGGCTIPNSHSKWTKERERRESKLTSY